MSSFLERFKKLEIPEEKRRIDWSFLEESLALPEPLPMGGHNLACIMYGKMLVPTDQRPTGDWILFYGEPLALTLLAQSGELEARWREQHQPELERQGKRFLDGIPTEIMRDHLDEALEILQLNAPRDLFGGERILRIHGKLYNLVTLQEYVRIFQKAIDPGLFSELQAMPATCTPEEMLAKIAGSLPLIHKKARSPLRNKMDTARAQIGGVTYLPIYREAAQGMIDVHRQMLERELKVAILKRHA
jgi:hypothetical protein